MGTNGLAVNHFGNYILRDFNYCLEKCKFTCVQKHADDVQLHKKKTKSEKANCRPINILPNFSKIYEKLMYQQLYEHFNSIFSLKKCGF